MLLVCFCMGDERYALDAAKVQQVVPVLRLKKIPTTPTWVAGLMRYHGQAVPVIDLCALHLDRKSRAWLSTRIIVVRFTAHDATEHLLGLLCEKVTGTLRRHADDFMPAGVDAPGLGGVVSDQEGLLQWVKVDQLLPAQVQHMLFQPDHGTAL